MKRANKKSKGNSVKAIPDGMSSITPYLIAENASGLLDFIVEAFDGEVTATMKGEDGKIMHANVQVGDSQVMVADPTDKYAPATAMLYLYVEDVDTVYQAAIDAGGTSIREPLDEFYGDRSAGVRDAWNNQWWIASHVENVSDEEMKKRQEDFREHEVSR